ncbi:MAG: acetylxylan esterase [Planctomycetes bacterium]|nr:acetylxylan esterase [Planctomycetota bacterium]
MTPAARRAQLYGLLGDLPPRDRPITVETLSTEQRDGYVVEKLRLDLNGSQPVPAYFVRPATASGRIPVVLYNHSHGGKYTLGKDELFKGSAPYLTPYADDLLQRGWAVLAIDHWLFGERSGRAEIDLFKEMLWNGKVVWGQMVYDNLRAIDYLVSRPDVDPKRIATLGMSMGSTMAWYTAALDERIIACADLCCLTDFHALIDSKGLGGHGIYYYVPNLLKHFSTTDINALIVPRPHLALAGTQDKLTPVAGLDTIDTNLTRLYTAAGVPERWKLIREDVGHLETPTMRAAVLAFLEKWLAK